MNIESWDSQIIHKCIKLCKPSYHLKIRLSKLLLFIYIYQGLKNVYILEATRRMAKLKLDKLPDLLVYRQFRDKCMRSTSQFRGFLIGLGEEYMMSSTCTDNPNLTPNHKRLRRTGTAATTPAFTKLQNKKEKEVIGINLGFLMCMKFAPAVFMNTAGNILTRVEYNTYQRGGRVSRHFQVQLMEENILSRHSINHEEGEEQIYLLQMREQVQSYDKMSSLRDSGLFQS